MHVIHTAAALAMLVGTAALPAEAAARCERDPATGKAAEAISIATPAGGFRTGENEFTVTVHDAQCVPVAGATVRLELVMPAMPGMPEMRNTVTLAPPNDPKAANAGTYTGRGQIFMAGAWQVTVRALVKGKPVATRTLTITSR
jgi:hypothetical protein